ncbi:ADP-ribosylglycohydrolase family protein [Aquibacillus albus]|uniref:ADP-ribosylglycohydrolase n=1 Tax=Aquibacillus albus TaxID=1168171 RepID=A0ABS2MW90_9BACI|nr:ADP-ribosylglycohydrolase family protein [Aquibacillus albus]MBM7570152.1 ADP-ribosylglycohydrolase [Aquibacillus albus]
MKIKDKCMGAYIGAAIGDAMGGPVEAQHYKRIQKYAGEVKGLLPYGRPVSIIDLKPGYALHPDPGCITDDTFIRKDLTNFYLETKAPRTPQMLVDWLLENAELEEQWPDIMVEALYKVKNGEATAEDCGLTFKQGGGVGWWTPIAIIHAGNPKKAADQVRNLSRIWKAPLEQDLLAAKIAAIAEGVKEDATYESMVEAMFEQCGPLATQLLERAINIANKAENVWDLAEKFYQEALMPDHTMSPYKKINEYDPPIEVDAPMPERVEPIDYKEDGYTCCFFAEQIPLALAAFAYAKGNIESIPVSCNLGRDCDTTATIVGAWVGALHGESGLPTEWVDPVCEVNKREMDIRKLSEQICELEE